MKRLLVSLLMISTSQASTPMEILDKNFQSIKETRARLNGRALTPHNFGEALEKSKACDNIITGKTYGISQDTYATPNERVRILGGMLQQRILSDGPFRPVFDPIDPEIEQANAGHFRSFYLMMMGINFMFEAPYQAGDYSLFIRNFEYYHADQKPFQDLKAEYGDNTDRALEILFPRGFFMHAATYALNFSDYENQQALKLGIARHHQWEPVTLTVQQGFFFPKEWKGEKKLTLQLDGEGLEAPIPEGSMFLQETAGAVESTQQFYAMDYDENNKDRLYGTLFSDSNDRVPGTLGQVVSRKGDRPFKEMPAAEFAARLLMLNAKEKFDVEKVGNQFAITGWHRHSDGAKTAREMLETLFVGMDIKLTDVYDALGSLSLNHLDLSMQDLRIEIMFLLQWLGGFEDDDEKASIKPERNVFHPTLMDPKFYHYDEKEQECSISYPIQSQITKASNHAEKAKQFNLQQAVQDQVDKKIIGGNLKMPMIRLFGENTPKNPGYIQQYVNILNNPIYRDEDFLTAFCQAIHREGEANLSQEAHKEFAGLLKSTDLDRPLSRHLYDYLLTLSFFQNRFPDVDNMVNDRDYPAFWGQLSQEERDRLLEPYHEDNDYESLSEEEKRGVRNTIIDNLFMIGRFQDISWLEKKIQAIDAWSAAGVHHDPTLLTEEEFQNGTFVANMEDLPYEVVNEKGEKLLHLPKSLPELVALWGDQLSPTAIASRMYAHEEVFRGFYKLQDNINGFSFPGSEVNLDDRKTMIVQEMKNMDDFNRLPIPALNLLVDLYYESIGT